MDLKLEKDLVEFFDLFLDKKNNSKHPTLSNALLNDLAIKLRNKLTKQTEIEVEEYEPVKVFGEYNIYEDEDDRYDGLKEMNMFKSLGIRIMEMGCYEERIKVDEVRKCKTVEIKILTLKKKK